MMKPLFLTFGFVLLAHVALAGEELAAWQSVTIRAEQEVAVTAVADGSTMRSLVMEIAGAKIEVPAAELAELHKPRLNTIQIVFGALRNKTPYRIVRLDFGDPVMVDGEPEFHTASFMFHSGRYQSKNIIRVTTPGS